MLTCLDLGLLVHQLGRKRDVVDHAHVVEQIEVLEDHADLFAHLVDVHLRVVQVMPVDHDPAAGGVFQSVKAAQQRGLACAGGTDDADHLTTVHGQIHSFDDFDIAVALAEIRDLDHHIVGAGSTGHAVIEHHMPDVAFAHRFTFLSTILASHVSMVMATK